MTGVFCLKDVIVLSIEVQSQFIERRMVEGDEGVRLAGEGATTHDAENLSYSSSRLKRVQRADPDAADGVDKVVATRHG